MRGFHFDRILAGTALALVLTLAGQAQSQSNSSSIDAAVPVPEAADVPPPTAADIAKSAPTVTPGPQTAPAVAPPAQSATTTGTQAPAAAPEVTATAPAAAPAGTAPAAAAPLDPFAEKLREILAGKSDRLFSRKGERAGVEAFYRERNYAPLWVNNGAPSARATEAIAYLRGVDADGLEPSEYPVPDFKSTDPAAMA